MGNFAVYPQNFMKNRGQVYEKCKCFTNIARNSSFPQVYPQSHILSVGNYPLPHSFSSTKPIKTRLFSTNTCFFFPQPVGNYVGNCEKPPIYHRFESFPHFFELPTIWGLSDNFGFIEPFPKTQNPHAISENLFVLIIYVPKFNLLQQFVC